MPVPLCVALLRAVRLDQAADRGEGLAQDAVELAIDGIAPVVELLRRDGSVLHVRGVDMLDGTPILDLKPYLSSVPAENLRRGWLAEAEARQPEKS